MAGWVLDVEGSCWDPGLPSVPRPTRSGSGTGHGNARRCGTTAPPRHSGHSGPNSCSSCRCSSYSRRSGSCRTTSRSCCRSGSSWSGAVPPLSGNSGSLGHGSRRPSGRWARPGGAGSGAQRVQPYHSPSSLLLPEILPILTSGRWKIPPLGFPFWVGGGSPRATIVGVLGSGRVLT